MNATNDDTPRPPDHGTEFADWFADELSRFDTLTLKQIREFAQVARSRSDARHDGLTQHVELTIAVQLQLLRKPSRVLNAEDDDLRLEAWCEGFGLSLDEYIAARRRGEGGAS
jgi:hypothetical protein